MRLPQSLRLDPENHWIGGARGPDGQELPATVLAKWNHFARQSRRSRNGHFTLEALVLISAAAIPVSAAVSTSVEIPAALGAMVVILSGLRQLFALHEEWISSSQAQYAIEREVALFVVGFGLYQGPNASTNLVITVEDVASSEGTRFVKRRERASELLSASLAGRNP
jgi:hypothetical protein